MPRWHNPVLRKPGIIFPMRYYGAYFRKDIPETFKKSFIKTGGLMPICYEKLESWEIQT